MRATISELADAVRARHGEDAAALVRALAPYIRDWDSASKAIRSTFAKPGTTYELVLVLREVDASGSAEVLDLWPVAREPQDATRAEVQLEQLRQQARALLAAEGGESDAMP